MKHSGSFFEARPVFACHLERFGYGISLAVAISDFFFNLITLLIGLEVLANNAL